MPLFANRAPNYSFAAGVLSSTLLARGDLKAWDSGLRDGANWALLLQGGMKRRPGTDLLDILDEETRLLGFVNSAGTSYLLAMQHTALKIYNSDGDLLQSITGCPWSGSTMWDVRYTQKFDTAFFADNNGAYRARKLTVSGGVFTLSSFAYETALTTSGDTLKRCPFMKFAASSITMNSGGVTALGAVTLTLSSGYWINAAVPFGHVGINIRWKGKQIRIDAVTSTTVATGEILEALPNSAEDADWEEEAFSGIYGYETAICLHSSRLVIAGPAQAPTQIWASKAGAFFNFDDGTGDAADSIWYVLSADRVSRILHLVSSQHLQVFTDGGVGYAPEGLTTPLTPADFDVRMRTPFASSGVRPHIFDLATLYCTEDGRAVRGLLLSSDSNIGYEDEYTSQLADELIDDPVDLDVLTGSQDRPEQYAFLVNSDGTLAVFLGSRLEKIAGWMPWTTGPGQGTNEDGEGEFRSVAVVNQEVYFVVFRQIAGVRQYALEKLNWDSMLDCSLTFESTMPRTDWSAADTFAGSTVRASSEFYSAESGAVIEAANCFDLGDVAVNSSGEFDTPYTTPAVRLGYPFYPTATLLPFDLNTADFGTTMGTGRRMKALRLNLKDTRNVRVNGTRLKVLTGQFDPSLEPPSLNGWRTAWKLGWKRNGQDVETVIDQDQNVPCEILAAARDMVF